MGTKEIIVQLLKDDGLDSGFLTRTIPTLSAVTAGTDLESSAIAISQFCANENEFLKIFEGVAFGDYLLKGMQRSSGLIALVLTSLQAIVGGGIINVLSPDNATEWAGFIPCSVQGGDTIDDVLVTGVDPWDTIEMTSLWGLWQDKLILTPGVHALSFVGKFDTQQTNPENRSTLLAKFTCYPADEGNVDNESDFIHLYTGAATTVPTIVTVTLDTEEPVTLIQSTGEWITPEAVEWGDGEHTLHWLAHCSYGGVGEDVLWDTVFLCL